ncbi:Bug family tripartite tricarboxylate transporter substrate binding protein [Derxia gummosa]|uniref:Bug family tripartite tricarboxylate transporter substrate binding protein n=1 Tax=Derxia gummosa DSM 723 TaxID=1121388 RepID=A0A8B6X5Q7_9BURK|nr:tripartite tricarboxylate transporter substrate binding protein [Derxia gummosa]
MNAPSRLRRRLLSVAGGAGVLAALPRLARAASYPDHPVSYVVPYPPGATSDNTARIVSQKLAEKLGQPFVIDNRPGAGGGLGTEYAAKARPDGYTLLNATSAMFAVVPQLIKAGYDSFKDFTPLGLIGNSVTVLAVRNDLPVNSVAELIAYSKKHPGTLNYATSGNGSGGHLSVEYLKLKTGLDAEHVPYKGSAAAANDLVAGRVDMFFDPLAAQFARAGKIKALAIAGAKQSELLPGVPPIQTAVPDWEFDNYFFVAAPAGIPDDIRRTLVRAVGEVIADPGVVEKLKALSLVPVAQTPEQIAARIRRDFVVAGDIIRRGKVVAD